MFAFGVLVLHLATAGAQPPPPPPPGCTGKPARKPTSAPQSKSQPRAKTRDLLPKPKTQAASWPRGVERPPHMRGPGRDPRYNNRGYGSDLRRKKLRAEKREAEAAAEAEAQAAAAAAAEAEAQARAKAQAQEQAHAKALAEVLAGTGNGSANALAACISRSLRKRSPAMSGADTGMQNATRQLLAMQEAHACSTEQHADHDTAWDPAETATAKRASLDPHADERGPLEEPGSSSSSTTWGASPGLYITVFTTEPLPWRSRPEDPGPKPSSRAPTGCFKVACAGKAPRGCNPAQDGPPQALPEMTYPIVPRTGFYNVWN